MLIAIVGFVPRDASTAGDHVDGPVCDTGSPWLLGRLRLGERRPALGAAGLEELGELVVTLRGVLVAEVDQLPDERLVKAQNRRKVRSH